nr:unnamed protein product [Spirometra erinaceieuropaei]
MVKICPSAEENPQNCEQASSPRDVCTYPQAAETFTAEAIDGEHIQFNWSLPTQTLRNLNVFASASNQNQTETLEVSAQEGASMAILDGLRPLTQYNAIMFVRNPYSNKHNISKQVICVLTAPNPPTVKIIEVSQTSMTVSLVPAAGSENFNLTYVVKAASEHAPEKECTTSDQTHQRQCTLLGLETATEYSVTAKACNGKQCSLESQRIIQQLESTASPSEDETTTTMSETTRIPTPCTSTPVVTPTGEVTPSPGENKSTAATDPTPVPTATPSEDKSTAATDPTPVPTATPSEDKSTAATDPTPVPTAKPSESSYLSAKKIKMIGIQRASIGGLKTTHNRKEKLFALHQLQTLCIIFDDY